MADDVEVINIVLANLHNAVHKMYSIYILVIHAAMEEATNQTYHASLKGLKGMQTLKACTGKRIPHRPQLHDTGFVSERHQFKVFSSLVCYYNFLYMKFLFNYIILS